MFILKILCFSAFFGILHIFSPEGAWAWGPGVHTVVACRILGDLGVILPAVAAVIRAYPLEYLYGSLAADFFVGKGVKPKDGHSHNWETGFRFLDEAKDEREASYAYGFLSHLASDVIAHNYFIPPLIQQGFPIKSMGHIYWETAADCMTGPVYTRLAREILGMEHLGCDDQLKAAVGKRLNGLKTRRRLFTQSVKFTDYLNVFQPKFLVNPGDRHELFPYFMASLVQLSYRVTRHLLLHPDDSPCLDHDPIGSRNLLLASKKAIKKIMLSKLFKIPRPSHRFKIDRALLSV